MNKRELGSKYELRAAEFLKQNGYSILEKNYRCRFGEIDLIGRSEGYLCFIEVKYRSDSGYGFPSEAVDLRKIRRICRTALSYISFKKLPADTACRFDIVVILDKKFTLIKNAFEGIY